MTSDLQAKIAAAWRLYLGVPYYFGGESRSGIDCSGLIRCGWTELGVWPFDNEATEKVQDRDATADMIWRSCVRIPWEEREPGDAVCYGKPERATHVVGVLSRDELIGANGGRPPQPEESPEEYREAMRVAGARVKITPSTYRAFDRLGVVRSPLVAVTLVRPTFI